MKKTLIVAGIVAGVLAVVATGVFATILLIGLSGAEAASQAAKTNDALESIRTNGQTIVCGAFHKPLIIAGVPLSYSKEEGYLKMQDGYMLHVEPFSFYSGKFTGLQIDPETREVTRSILVGDKDYYPCPQQRAAPPAAPTAPTG